MIFLENFLNKSLIILFIISVLTFNPSYSYSAEILSINTSNKIEIGDQNRNLKINLFCINVEDKDEAYAMRLLKKEFPRGTKVKIKLYGKENNNLLAKVYHLNNNLEMTEILFSNNLSKGSCEN